MLLIIYKAYSETPESSRHLMQLVIKGYGMEMIIRKKIGNECFCEETLHQLKFLFSDFFAVDLYV